MYPHPKDGQWSKTPNARKFGTATALIMDGAGFGAEGDIYIQVGNHDARIHLSCPTVFANECTVMGGHDLVYITNFNEKGDYSCTINVK